MLTLKQYQQRALDALRDYLRATNKMDDAKMAFVYQTERPYHTVPKLPGLPYVCLRIPTGGGKTLMACYAVGLAVREFLRTDHGLILWLVPTNIIREQTLAALKDRQHPYRQALDAAFNGRVTVMDLGEALYLQRNVLDGETCIIVSTLAALRVEDTDGRKVYEPNGALMSHFTGLDAALADTLEKHADGGIDYSLCNVLRLRRPVVIMDEAHNARTPLSFDTLARFNPACILEFTATPDQEKSPSNVLHHVSAAELKAEAMIKLPIRLETQENWQETIVRAVEKRAQLVQMAQAERREPGEYLRPIVLLQAQPRRQGQQTITVDALKEVLQKDFKVAEEEIAIATGEQKELEGVNLFDPACPINFVITVQALREGWDCSFAYVLCSVAEMRSGTAVEQILGRVLRLPRATSKKHEELNRAYAFVASRHFAEVANALADALVENGFERFEARTMVERPIQPTLLPLWDQIEAVQKSPAERGEHFTVPQLAIWFNGRWEPLEESHFLQGDWDLSQYDTTLALKEPQSAYVVEISVSELGKLQTKFISDLQQQLSLLTTDRGWTLAELTVWLDRNIPHPDITQTQASLYIHRVLEKLLDRLGFSMERLVHDKYRLRDVIAAKIDIYRQSIKDRAFQQILAPEFASRLEVSPEIAFRYDPKQYPANWYYEGRYQFQKHYYPQVGELEPKGEEFECARRLDLLPQVKFWVRNLKRQPNYSFWLQTSTDKFYPDFVAQLTDGRLLVMEYKGQKFLDSADTKEKKTVGELWEARSKGRCLFRMATAADLDRLEKLIEEK